MRIDLYKTEAKSPKETIGYEHTSKGTLMISRMERWRADMKSAWKNKGKNCQEQKEKTWQYFQEDGGDWITELGIIVLLEKLKLYIQKSF